MTLNDETLKTTTSNIISISHSGTESMRKDLIAHALPYLLRFAVNSIHAEKKAAAASHNTTADLSTLQEGEHREEKSATDNERVSRNPSGRFSTKEIDNDIGSLPSTISRSFEARESVVRAVSQLVRCSRTDSIPVTASSNSEVLFMVSAVLHGVGEEVRPTSSALTLMHACDLLRYTLASLADRQVAHKERVLPLLQEIIAFSTQLDKDNDLVKSAFQALLALGPAGEFDVFDVIYQCFAAFFFHSSVVTPALASIMSISSYPEGLHFLVETEVCDLVNKSITLFKDNKTIHAYAKRVLRNQLKAGADVSPVPTSAQSQSRSQKQEQDAGRSNAYQNQTSREVSVSISAGPGPITSVSATAGMNSTLGQGPSHHNPASQGITSSHHRQMSGFNQTTASLSASGNLDTCNANASESATPSLTASQNI